jgi:hypothetical protein
MIPIGLQIIYVGILKNKSKVTELKRRKNSVMLTLNNRQNFTLTPKEVFLGVRRIR